MKGAGPPKKKVVQSAPEKLAHKRKYDSTDRKRAFQHHWLTQYKWLEYKEVAECVASTSDTKDETATSVGTMRMYCQICRKYEKVGSFVVGSPVFKLESIKSHNTSASHVKWSLKEKAATHPGAVEKAISQLGEAAHAKMCILFRNAHAIAKHARPYTDFVWMCALDEVKGVQIGRTYHNDKQCAEFIHHIAQARRCVIREIIDQVKFISLICDGSTDSSRTEAELAFIRCCHKGAISVHFVGVKNVAKGDAQGIEEAISTLFTQFFGGRTWERKLVGTGTDGASNMLGKNNGFVARLRARLNRPELVGVHCSAHRNELAYKDAARSIKLYEKVDSLLLSMYLFYRNSPLNRSNLKEAFIAIGEPPRIPSRVGGTRWIGHVARAISNVLVGYKGIMAHLSQVSI